VGFKQIHARSGGGNHDETTSEHFGTIGQRFIGCFIGQRFIGRAREDAPKKANEFLVADAV
jgi:hypothetical protein